MTLVTSRTTAAAKHLQLLRNENNPDQDRRYVKLAASYDMPPAEIAFYSGIPVERVREILAED